MLAIETDTMEALRNMDNSPWKSAYNVYDQMYTAGSNVLSNQQRLYELNEFDTLNKLNYDYNSALNQAYQSSLAQQNSIQNSNLFDTYKTQNINAVEQNLQSAFEQYRASYLENKSNVQQNYNDIYSSIDKQRSDLASTIQKGKDEVTANLQKEAQNFNTYDNYHFDYLYSLYENNPEIFNDTALYSQFINPDTGELVSREEFAMMLTEDATDENGDTYRTLSDKGRGILSMLENYNSAGTKSWSEYLYDTDQDIYKWAFEGGSDTYRNIQGFTDYYELKDNELNSPVLNKAIESGAYHVDGRTFKLTSDNLVTTEYFNYDADKSVKKLMENESWYISSGTAKTPDEFLRAKEDMVRGHAGIDSNADDIIEKVVEKAKKGTLKNGTVINVNKDGGNGRSGADEWDISISTEVSIV